MDDAELRTRFPRLDTSSRSPLLGRLNGCGFALFFHRDDDPETGTYVKTYCVSVAFIPIFPICAYRVADAPGGAWYILGTEPASVGMRRARQLAAAVVVLVASSICWEAYKGSDGYVARRQLTIAREAAEGRLFAEAASRFTDIAAQRPWLAEEARDGVRDLLAAIGPATSPRVAFEVFRAAHDMAERGGPLVPDLWKRAVEVATDPGRASLEEQAEVLHTLAPFAPDAATVETERRRVAERGAAATPPDVWAISELAAAREAARDVAGAEAMLVPHAARLGASEGARILGQIRAAQGRADEAIPFLDAYVAPRMERLREVVDEFRSVSVAAEESALRALRDGGEDAAWYERVDAADEATQRALVAEAVSARMMKNEKFVAARANWGAATRVVFVAMDLGIVRMERARGLSDPAEARSELERAERVFNAIDGVAAGEPDYEYAAARVAFWLGKRDVCDAHLDAALNASGDTFETRAKIAVTLTSLGETAGARKHWESAFALAKTPDERGTAALAVAAALRDDPDAALAWARKASSNVPSINAPVFECEGRAALVHGDLAAAETAFRKSLAEYDRAPKTSTGLNNAALVALQLSSLTGRADTLVDAANRLRAALAEQPSNLVVIANTASALAAAGWLRTMDDRVDLRLGVSTLRDLRYDDAAGRAPIRAAALASEEMREAIRLFDRGIALASTNAELITSRADLADELGDEPCLRALAELVASRPPETESGRAAFTASVARAKDPAAARGILDALRGQLAALPADATAGERAAVEAMLLQTSSQVALSGGDIDVADLDARARRLHATFPSSESRVTERITAALLVHHALRAANERYARESERTSAIVGPEMLVAEALFRDETLRESVRASADFRRLIALIEESDRKFPGEIGATSRTLLRIARGTPIADPAAPRGALPAWALQIRIDHACAPYLPRAALSYACVLRIAGDDAGAELVLRECARQGGPVPYLESR